MSSTEALPLLNIIPDHSDEFVPGQYVFKNSVV
jgi:hypothetical protein